jgi:tRNA threonylcarbamoyladenosine modification (KEOPS) complex  Pcc1 subunit
MHVQKKIVEIQINKRAHRIKKREKKKLNSNSRSRASIQHVDLHIQLLRGARSLSNIKTSFSQFKMVARASRIMEKET